PRAGTSSSAGAAAPAHPPPSPDVAAVVLPPAAQPSRAATVEIPPVMLALYQQSARQCPGLPWTVLAGIGHVESDHGRMVVKPSDGAAGPMRILPTIWSAFAIDGNHD